MSTKLKTVYTCSFCGYQAPKWLGKCPDCDQWNTFYEEIRTKKQISSICTTTPGKNHPVAVNKIDCTTNDSFTTGIGELDRVLGGGIVKGSVVLIGGDPGIGKSTLVLQALATLAKNGCKTLYVTGEESLRQIRMRAERLGAASDNLYILAETSLEQILSQIQTFQPSILVIDSVQTIHTAELESAPGSVSQIRETSAKLINLAKTTDTASFLIGHVTKEGAIAGPRVLEHMVDTVLYFEGDRGHSYRILRAVKNRFGSTDEIGVFEMAIHGLCEVKNPSRLFIAERPVNSPGSTVVPSIEGTRPILVEIQALVSPTALTIPRRTTMGIDHNRASILIAVVEKKVGIRLYDNDIFLNIAGGIKLNEPGVDLGIIMSIISSKLDKPVPPLTAFCGEVGLTGEVRTVSQISARIKEAERLGFTRCIVPENSLKNTAHKGKIGVTGIKTINEAINNIFKQTER